MQSGNSRLADTMRAHAAALLVTNGALVELSAADARCVVSYMRLQPCSAGDVVIRAGEAVHNDFMALLLDGEITVESSAAAAQESMVVSVLGPGSLLGEMGLIDNQPRSATCTAATDLLLAVFSRQAMHQLMKEEQGVAARLLLAMAKRIADHLRETTRKLMTFAQVSKALQQELEATHSVNQRLLERESKRFPLPSTFNGAV
jgi:CRP-like cAMP-binding protein